MEKKLKHFDFILLILFLLVTIRCNKKPELVEQDLFGVFPNPCRSTFYIYANLDSEEETIVSVFGTDGELLIKEDLTLGTNGSIAVDVSEEEEGIIHLLVEQGDKSFREEVLKIK